MMLDSADDPIIIGACTNRSVNREQTHGSGVFKKKKDFNLLSF
jgi:hypothetical protein